MKVEIFTASDRHGEPITVSLVDGIYDHYTTQYLLKSSIDAERNGNSVELICKEFESPEDIFDYLEQRDGKGKSQ